MYSTFLSYSPSGHRLQLLGVGLAAGVALSLIAQISEQVDYLRFMPLPTRMNRVQWWTAVLAAGPGWVILGAAKQIAGGLLAVWILDQVGRAAAVEPIQQFTPGLGLVLPTWAVLAGPIRSGAECSTKPRATAMASDAEARDALRPPILRQFRAYSE